MTILTQEYVQTRQWVVSILIRNNLRHCIHSWGAINKHIIKMNVCLNRNEIIGTYGVNDEKEFFERPSYKFSIHGIHGYRILRSQMYHSLCDRTAKH